MPAFPCSFHFLFSLSIWMLKAAVVLALQVVIVKHNGNAENTIKITLIVITPISTSATIHKFTYVSTVIIVKLKAEILDQRPKGVR